MPFDKVKLTLNQAANGTYSVSPSPAIVRWRGKQAFTLDVTDPSSNDPGQPTGQPFQLGPSTQVGPFRTAELTFVGTLGGGPPNDWQPCFASSDALFQFMVVTDYPTLETLEVDLCCAAQPQIALQFVRAVEAVATATLQFLIAVFTLRIFRHSKEEEELPEPAHNKGH